MQTFLPYPDFLKSAQCLDNKRLGKQRVEALQILRIITGEDSNSRWKNHPAVRMWRGYADALANYTIIICKVWSDKGYKDSCKLKVYKLISKRYEPDNFDVWKDGRVPFWLGTSAFHLAHQSNLVRKMPEHYRQYFPNIPDDLPYIWPV